MIKSIDFVYMGGNCPSDGCPECFFNHKRSFDNEYTKNAFLKATQIIIKYPLTETNIPNASPLRTPKEISDFVDKIQKLVSNCENITTIYSCKHGKILYQKSIRFIDIQNTGNLAKKIQTALPINLEKEKNRPIQSYFMEVK